jgi:hypothetical protein
MQNRIFKSCIVFAVIASLAMPLHVVAKERAFVVTEKHYFLGRWIVSLNKDRVKATSIVDGFSIVAIAPSWKVVFCRDDTRKSFETPMATFLKIGLAKSGGYVTEAFVENSVPVPVTYKGLQAISYTFYRDDKTMSKPAWTLADVPKEAGVRTSKYWISPVISDQPTICHFLQKLFMVPPAKGYPVAFIDTRTDNTTNAVLDILSCKVKTPSDVQIEYPKNYTVCKDQHDVTISVHERQNIDEWARSLGK